MTTFLKSGSGIAKDRRVAIRHGNDHIGLDIFKYAGNFSRIGRAELQQDSVVASRQCAQDHYQPFENSAYALAGTNTPWYDMRGGKSISMDRFSEGGVAS